LKTLSLSTFLGRLIWLCVLPPVILAIYFAVHEVRTLQDQENQEAEDQVRNIARDVESRLQALILPLQVLAASSSVDDPPRLSEFYNECKAFQTILGVHVILADTSKQMLLNTRAPYGASLPKLPPSKGHAAAPAVLETGKPAVGDLVFGPVANEPLIAVAVPVIRDDRVQFLLLSTIGTRQFQQRLDQISIPEGWVVTVFDGANGVIARRSPPEAQGRSGEDEPGKSFVARSAVSRWSVVLKVPQSLYRSQITEASALLAVAILAVTFVAVVSGRGAAQRLTKSVVGLAEAPTQGVSRQSISEIEVVRNKLADSAEARDEAEAKLQESEQRYRDLYENAPDMYASVDATGGQIIQCNETLLRVTGYSKDEVIGHPVFRLYHPDGIQAAQEAFRSFRLAGKVDNAELQLRRKDGSKVYVMLNASAVYDDSGNIVYSRSSLRDIDDRKRAEEALRESELLYRTVFEGARDAIMLIDMEGDSVGRIVSANPVAAKIHGYSLDEFVGLRLEDLETSDSARGLPERVKTALSGELVRGEVEHRRKDGSVFTLEISASLLEISDHKYCISIDRDISERKLALERQTRLNHLQQALLGPENLVTKLKMITDGVVDIWGADLCRVWHIALGDLCEEGCIHAAATEGPHVCVDRRRCLQLLASSGRYTHTDGVAHRRVPFGAYKIGRVASGKEHKFLTKDVTNDPRIHDREWAQELGLVAFAGYQLRPPGGETIGVLALFSKHPISPEEDAQLDGFSNAVARVIRSAQDEERLKESEAKFREFFMMANDCVFITSPDWQWIDFNDVALKMLGYENRAELLQTRMPQFCENQEDAERMSRLMMENEEVKDFSIRMKRKDGAIVDTLVSAKAKKLRDGTVINFSGAIRDVTERKRLQDQLFQAQKMEAVGTLAGGVAHDFNNVLQVALGYSELLLGDEKLPKHCRSDLRKVYDSAKRGADLVQRLMTFSRKTEIKPQPLNLNRRITELRKILERTIPKMVEIDLHLTEDIANINADPIQMDQILMNLAVNARDAMPDGGRLTIETANVVVDEEYARTHLDAQPGPHVLLMVTDTGFGMDKDTLEHIFEPFYTTKGMGEGTGLGLAMFHGIVKQHGGHIRCYSKPGRGTTFKIYFPTIPSMAEPAIEETGIMPAFGTETVLLVDDEDFVRDLGERILTKSGYTVLTASRGKEALEIYSREKDRIALIILDLVMPAMGGKECLMKILDMNSHAKVFIASGYAADTSTKECIELGARGFVAKPFRFKELLQQVRKVLDEASTV
jgi:PAS domain S-box-containing protein